MRHFTKLLAAMFLCSLFVATRGGAAPSCHSSALANQRLDASTVQRLEKARTVAYLKGDLDFERCLLTSDFTEIMRTGEVKVLADELEFARKNIGKNLPIPDLPEGAVFIHGNVAVAYGQSSSTGPSGAPRKTRYADYYIWQRNSWHAFFAQQTAIE